eukprot:TRINITY_DN647_c0_g1_i1.p1 TRINITY_DN647_c0_g1~~TRINITY_DN647_c0_g1_i1.p1  ORF type:complete len:170 (+),score=33.36 TRINITY_DN647_c0_g1_i1:63-572(+)
MQFFNAAVAMLFVASASADLEITRDVKSIMSGLSGSVIVSSGCSKQDQYGSNDCDLKWGSNYTVSLNATLPEDVTTGATFHVDILLDGLVKAEFTCPLCGGNCSFEVAKHKQNFAMPPCPLVKAGHFQQVANFTLPADAPAKVGFKGTVSAKDSKGVSFAEVELDGKLH